MGPFFEITKITIFINEKYTSLKNLGQERFKNKEHLDKVIFLEPLDSEVDILI